MKVFENLRLTGGIASLLLTSIVHGADSDSSIGFGNRNAAKTAPVPTPASSAPTKATAPSVPKKAAPTPPLDDESEWLRISFDKAEDEVLALFSMDLPKLEERAQSIAVYEIRTTGGLPADYSRKFRNKLERVILTSKKLKLKECRSCEEARLVRTENGELRYEMYSTDPSRPAKAATELGTDALIFAELNYSPEDLVLNIKLVNPTDSSLKFGNEYSTADVVKTREALIDSDSGSIGHHDAFSRVLIGEIAFTVVLAPGVSVLPSINTGAGSSLMPMPALDLFMGEKYDSKRKAFGFLAGFTIPLGGSPTNGQILPWGLRIAPQFKYNFNPYNIRTARYGVGFEMGAFISTGLTTPYVGLGPEISMINRFSVSLIPMYILPSDVSSATTNLTQPDGTTTTLGGKVIGKFGGPAVIAKVNINW